MTSVERRLDININKTKTTIIGSENGRTIMSITVNRQIIEQVTRRSYHGHLIMVNSRSETEIRNTKKENRNGEKYIQ